MSDAERHAYDRHIDNIMVQNDVLDTAKDEGRAEGRAEERIENARNLKANGVPVELIAKSLNISIEEINKL